MNSEVFMMCCALYNMELRSAGPLQELFTAFKKNVSSVLPFKILDLPDYFPFKTNPVTSELLKPFPY
jgi:hypothetical protein